MSAGDRAALVLLAIVVFILVSGAGMVLFIGTVVVSAIAAAFNA